MGLASSADTSQGNMVEAKTGMREEEEEALASVAWVPRRLRRPLQQLPRPQPLLQPERHHPAAAGAVVAPARTPRVQGPAFASAYPSKGK